VVVRSAWADAAKLVVITRVLFLTLAYAAAWLLAPTTGPLQDGFFDIWVRWDATHFLEIARFGYTDPSSDPHATAYFPLFPLLLRGIDGAGIPPVMGALVINTVATIVAGAFLFRLADEEIGEGSGRRAVLYLLLFPTTVFLIAPYSEALFLAGAVPAFYYARRGRWSLVGIPAAVACASRAAGLFVVAGLIFEFVRRRDQWARRWRAASASLVVALLPMAAYGAYLARIHGDPFYFFVDQREGWNRDLVGPLEAFRNTWELTTSNASPTNWIFTWRVEIVAAVVGLGLLAWMLARREWGYAAFTGLMMAALLTSTWYFSIPRMLLTLFPLLLLMASLTARRPGVHEIVIAVMAPVAALGVIVYTRGAWFY
jgi:hypothetical protein